VCRRLGLWAGLANAVLETLTLGKLPWTLHTRRADHEATGLAARHPPIDYAGPDGVSTFDLPSSLYRSGTNHEHDQPSHLQLRDPGLPEVVNKARYDGPESRWVGRAGGPGGRAAGEEEAGGCGGAWGGTGEGPALLP
jgi:electron-transferring-flavoprotein dehydrogenase